LSEYNSVVQTEAGGDLMRKEAQTRILEAIMTRRSVRHYLARPVDGETVAALLESARLAPSGSNTQPWHFVVIRSETGRRNLVSVCHDQKWMLEAPVLVACVADVRSRIKDDSPLSLSETSPEFEVKQIIRDTAIAAEHLVLQAQSMGLSTCWIGRFKQERIRGALRIPSDKYVVAVITVGYSDDQPESRPRKPLDEMVHFETWGGQP